MKAASIVSLFLYRIVVLGSNPYTSFFVLLFQRWRQMDSTKKCGRHQGTEHITIEYIISEEP